MQVGDVLGSEGEDDSNIDDSSQAPGASTSGMVQQQQSLKNQEDHLDELLINEVKAYRCLWSLWDLKARAYKEKPKKSEAWKQISTRLCKNCRFLNAGF